MGVVALPRILNEPGKGGAREGRSRDGRRCRWELGSKSGGGAGLGFNELEHVCGNSQHHLI